MPTEKTTKLLIGIVTTNELRFIAQCLDSVPASAKHYSLRVVLVDNCSSDGPQGLCAIGTRGLK